MSNLGHLLDPASIAIAGLSADDRKHGARVLGHLRRLGYEGEVWGINPRLPHVEGTAVYASIQDLPHPPDLIVAAVPARPAVEIVAAGAGAGAVVVFAAGFAESGPEGVALQEELARAATSAGTRVLGPNSGGVIRPGRRLAASFLTCLDRPPAEIRSGPVGLVTQSGGTGSYVHNLAAARGEGLAISVATGNEADIELGEAIEAVAGLDEVGVVMAVVETVRNGSSFLAAVRAVHERGKRLVVCRIGTGETGGSLMASHTGAMAVAPAILKGIFDSLGVVSAETPAEAYDVAGVLARVPSAAGTRVAIVTHSGGAAILLADLADTVGVVLPPPGEALRRKVEPYLDHGAAGNPLDLGGIIGGPSRFAEVVELHARSGEFDAVLAVSTAHPPPHTEERVASLLAIDDDTPVIHLWMAGDQAEQGLATLRDRGAAVTEEPRAAIRALAALLGERPAGRDESPDLLSGPLEDWGLPLEVGVVVGAVDRAIEAADRLGYPVVLKAEAVGLVHRTEADAVRLDLRRSEEVESAYEAVLQGAAAAGWSDARVRVQPYRPGLEMIIGALAHPIFGPLVSVGMGGVLAEMTADVVFAPAPIGEASARGMIDRLRGRRLLDEFRGRAPADVVELARIVSIVSRGATGGHMKEIEINPLVWDGRSWVGVDWFVAD